MHVSPEFTVISFIAHICLSNPATQAAGYFLILCNLLLLSPLTLSVELLDS